MHFMYALIHVSGKQYKVSQGDVISIDRISGKVGDKVEICDVLFIGGGKQVKIGSPKVEDAAVKAEIVSHFKGEKVIVFKKKRRHNYRRKQGHRQCLTDLRIEEIIST